MEIGTFLDVEEIHASRLLYDVEFDDNLDLPLIELKIQQGSRLSITNDYDDDVSKNCCVILIIEDV